MLIRLLLLFAPAAMAMAAPVKLAIIETSPYVGETALLLTASLSKKPNIALLERADIDKILRERALAGNDPAKVLNAMQILGADAAIFLDVPGAITNETINVRLVSVREGAILYSIQSQARFENPQRLVELLSTQIAATTAKIGADRSGVVPITLLNLRSPTSTAASELLDRELTSLLLFRLSHEANLLVLERRKLLDVALEKDFGARTEQFWSGAYVLDGIVDKDGLQPNRTAVSLRLLAPDKTATSIEVAGARTNVAMLVEEIAKQTLAAVKVGKSARWKPEVEAEELADEAKWALRWRMFPEAQAAADSAWALGNRTRAVAIIRALACARDQAPDLHHLVMSDLGGPSERIPDRERVALVLRALAVLDDLLAREPQSVSEPTTYAAICETLEFSGWLLWDFYTRPNARATVQSELAEIRERSRSIEKLTRTNPTNRLPLWLPLEMQGDLQRRNGFFQFTNNIARIAVRYTALFQETPEGAVEVYRDIVNAEGFPFIRTMFQNRSDKPPLIGGWKSNDRARKVEVWNSFINELLSSTNYAVHVEGRLLELKNQSDWRIFKAKFERLLADLEANWDKIKARKIPMHLDSLMSISFANGDITNVPAGEYEALHERVLQWIVDQGVVSSIMANGRLIKPRQERPAAPRLDFPKLPPATPIERSAELEVTDFWRANGSQAPCQLSGAAFRDGLLWFQLSRISPRETEIVGLNLQSKKQRVIKRPPANLSAAVGLTDYDHLPKSFEVRSNELFVVDGAMLRRMNLRTEQWRSMPLPEANADLYQVQGRLFLSGGESIYEIDQDDSMRVLASARLRPAVSILDEIEHLKFAPLTPGPKGAIRAFVEGNSYLFGNARWTREVEIGNLTCIPFDDSAFLATVGFPPVVQLRGFRAEQAGQRYIAAGIVVSNKPEVLQGHTNETLLEYHDILHGAPCYLGETPVLYLQTNHDAPNDSTRAMLLVFGANRERIGAISLHFVGADVSTLPEALANGRRRPWLLNTPQGLVIGHALAPGFWMIPRQQIDAAKSLASSPSPPIKP